MTRVEPLGRPTDAQLVARCGRGDEAAWSDLCARYQRLIYAIVLRMGLDEHAAADVFQTVFIRLVQHLPRIEQPDRLQAWIVTTAKREALLALQRARRTVSLTRDDNDEPAYDPPDQSPNAEAQLAQLQDAHQVRQALDRLGGRCQSLLLRLFASDEERPVYEDVARELNMPVGSIGPTRARCLAKLRQLLTD